MHGACKQLFLLLGLASCAGEIIFRGSSIGSSSCPYGTDVLPVQNAPQGVESSDALPTTLRCQQPVQLRSLLAPQPLHGLRPFVRHQSRRALARNCIVKAEMETQALLAVTQQGLFFAAVTAGETYLARQAVAPGEPGRPGIAPTAIACGGVAAAVGIIQLGGIATQVGLLLGVGVTAALLVRSGKRFADTKDDPYDWPGPKIWPFTQALLTFFAVCIFAQGFANTL